MTATISKKVVDLSRFYEEDLSVLDALVTEKSPQSIKDILFERYEWVELDKCDHCGTDLKVENNGYDEGEGATMYEKYCPKGC